MFVLIHSSFAQNETFWLKCRVCTVDTVARVAFCSTPAARLCAAWELGFSRTRTESAERKTSCCCVIGFSKSIAALHNWGLFWETPKLQGPAWPLIGRAGLVVCAALGWARGLRLTRAAFPRRSVLLRQGPEHHEQGGVGAA